MQKRKISFNWLHITKIVNGVDVFTNVESILPVCLEYICQFDKVQRKYDHTRNNYS